MPVLHSPQHGEVSEPLIAPTEGVIVIHNDDFLLIIYITDPSSHTHICSVVCAAQLGVTVHTSGSDMVESNW